MLEDIAEPGDEDSVVVVEEVIPQNEVSKETYCYCRVRHCSY